PQRTATGPTGPTGPCCTGPTGSSGPRGFPGPTGPCCTGPTGASANFGALAARATKTGTAQTVDNGTFTLVRLTDEVFTGPDIFTPDSGGVTPDNSKFTAPDNGFYLVTGAVNFAESNSTGTRQIGIVRNGNLSDFIVTDAEPAFQDGSTPISTSTI